MTLKIQAAMHARYNAVVPRRSIDSKPKLIKTNKFPRERINNFPENG